VANYRGTLLVVIGLSVILSALLLPKPYIAWNSGARERLSKSLRTIGTELIIDNEDPTLHSVDPLFFIARRIDNQIERPTHNANLLRERYGVSLNWYRNGAYEEFFFCPIAISSKIVMEPESVAEPTPQIVMVPVDQVDKKTLPNLYGCDNISDERLQECQWGRIRELFSTHGMDYAATLMSDGSVVYVQVSDLP